jgi:hypothetical protein
MTIDERMDRIAQHVSIEHLTPGMDDERKQQREEDLQLVRDTQRQIHETNAAVERVSIKLDAFMDETRTAIDRLAAETRAADEALGQRISELVSAMGVFIASQKPTA